MSLTRITFQADVVSTENNLAFATTSICRRTRRCDAAHSHFLEGKRCVLIACAGGTGRGTLECLTQFERGLTHMGMRVYDRISVVRYNRAYMLPALQEAGKTYAACLENGFDMYY